MVGAGGLASNLAPALRKAGHSITAVYSRTMAAAEELAREVDSRATDDISRLPLTADCFIVAVKDGAMQHVVSQLAENRQNQMMVHTAGSMPMALLEGYTQRYGVLWPMQTLSRGRRVDFSEVPLFIEASDDEVMLTLRSLAASVSRSVIPMSSEERKYMHLAAVFACNFANHCYALAAEIMEQHGLEFGLIQPLIAETARKIVQLHPSEAQTGPAVRYDQNVISRQAALLEGQPLVQQVYNVLSQSIHRIALEKKK